MSYRPCSRDTRRHALARALVLWMLGAGVALPVAALADDAPKKLSDPPDPEFLEFLGSVGSDDEDWLNYLAKSDAAEARRVAAAKASSPPPPPAANGGQKNDKNPQQ